MNIVAEISDFAARIGKLTNDISAIGGTAPPLPSIAGRTLPDIRATYAGHVAELEKLRARIVAPVVGPATPTVAGGEAQMRAMLANYHALQGEERAEFVRLNEAALHAAAEIVDRADESAARAARVGARDRAEQAADAFATSPRSAAAAQTLLDAYAALRQSDQQAHNQFLNEHADLLDAAAIRAAR